tara:strand:- start:39 stop:341 length:303 start_codon:yes stop_codon:yes gene_type:complete
MTDLINLNIDQDLSTDAMVAAIMPTLLTAIKQKAFVKGYEATDAEALGLVVSKFCEWNSEAITEVAAQALEDSNFDALATDFRTSQAYMHLHSESINEIS